MSTKNVKELIARLTAEGSLDEAKTKAEADFDAFCAEHGISATRDEWNAALEVVSDDDLDQVTGGKVSLSDLDIDAKSVDPTQQLMRNQRDTTH